MYPLLPGGMQTTRRQEGVIENGVTFHCKNMNKQKSIDAILLLHILSICEENLINNAVFFFKTCYTCQCSRVFRSWRDGRGRGILHLPRLRTWEDLAPSVSSFPTPLHLFTWGHFEYVCICILCSLFQLIGSQKMRFHDDLFKAYLYFIGCSMPYDVFKSEKI